MLLSSLIVAHVILTSAGYVGLIAANTWLLLLCRRRDVGLVLAAVSTWRTAARIFGPLLGLGLLLGFWLATIVGVGLGSLWLLWTYGLIVVALGAQAAIMIPWQLRAEGVVRNGGQVSLRPIASVLAVFSIAYVSIVALMVLR
jgi:hypothetical protein